MTFSWYLNGAEVAGERHQTLVIDTLTASKAGTYECRLVNYGEGSQLSNAIVLPTDQTLPDNVNLGCGSWLEDAESAVQYRDESDEYWGKMLSVVFGCPCSAEMVTPNRTIHRDDWQGQVCYRLTPQTVVEVRYQFRTFTQAVLL